MSLDYNLGISNKIVGNGEFEFDDAGTTSQTIELGAEYTLIDKLAISVGLPFALLKYTGDKDLYPHPGGGDYDDGTTHKTLTDLRANVAYQVLDGVVALSPHIGVSIPVADYETVGNTVAGRHLKQLHLGLAIGKVFGMAYFQAAYEFSLVEKFDETAETKEIGQNHSDGSLVIGYKLLEGKLDVNLGANFRLAHGGKDLSELNFANMTDPLVLNHDPILKENVVLAGGGIGYDLTEKLSLSLAVRAFVTGRNTQNANVIGLGLRWAAL
ncbi:MAG: hypothetical protein ABI867_05185 [Kofleriaceae bacterium]